MGIDEMSEMNLISALGNERMRASENFVGTAKKKEG
jgi:hypothetical protein